MIQQRQTASSIERSRISDAFPILGQIKDEKLRSLVVETWSRVLQEFPNWDLASLPNTDTAMGGSEKLVDHINRVGKVALALADAFQEAYGAAVNRDYLIADVLLHDVDKPAMYVQNGDKVEKTELWRRIPHGNYGALIAYKVGLPLEIVETILNHSPFASKMEARTMEQIILRHADHTCFQGHRVISGIAPIPGI